MEALFNPKQLRACAVIRPHTRARTMIALADDGEHVKQEMELPGLSRADTPYVPQWVIFLVPVVQRAVHPLPLHIHPPQVLEKPAWAPSRMYASRVGRTLRNIPGLPSNQSA